MNLDAEPEASGLARFTAIIVAPVLLAAATLLIGWSDRTDEVWAWTVQPPLTAVVIGAGYGAGAVFFARSAGRRRWDDVRIGYGGAAVLSSALLIATLVHWDKFNHDHVSFWAWLGLYLVTPVWLPALLVLHRRPRAASPAGDQAVMVPLAVRRTIGTLGVAQLALSAAMLVRPSSVIDSWPWQLTPLTTRCVAAFLGFVAAVWCAFWREGRWHALELPVQSISVGLALVAAGTVWRRDDLIAERGIAVGVFVAVLVSIVAGLGALQVAMARERRRQRRPTVAGTPQDLSARVP